MPSKLQARPTIHQVSIGVYIQVFLALIVDYVTDLPGSIGVDNTAGPSNSAGGPFESAACPDEFAASLWTDGNPNTVDDDLVDSVREPDDMKVEYHPKTKIPAKIYRFGDYGRDRNVPPASAFDSDPWHPGFDSRLNFEFAELILECAMNKKQIDRLLSIVRCIADDPSQFSFTKYQDIKDAWDIAGQAHPLVCMVSCRQCM